MIAFLKLEVDRINTGIFSDCEGGFSQEGVSSRASHALGKVAGIDDFHQSLISFHFNQQQPGLAERFLTISGRRDPGSPVRWQGEGCSSRGR